MDWAETIVENLYTEGVDGDGYPCRQRMEKALRKAKADGMREAAESVGKDEFWRKRGNGVVFFLEQPFKDQISVRANAIEKGTG